VRLAIERQPEAFMNRLYPFLCLLYLVPVPVVAQRRAMTAQDLITMDRPSEPAISPDGRWIAYTVTTTDLQANRRRTDLFMVGTAAGASALKVSTDSLGGRDAKWSPDGTRLAYVSSRGGTPQIWTYAPQGSVRRQVTTLSTGADGIMWSPDGRMLAFASEVYPDCSDDACNQRRATEDEHRPSRARAYDGLLYRHWTQYEDGLRSHVFVVDAAGGSPARDLLAGKDYDSPVPPFGGAEQYAFSSDSRTIAFTTKLAVRDQAWTTNLDIYTVPVSGGEPTLVTAGMGGAESTPLYTADGRYLCFLSQERANFESDRWRLMVKDLRSGQARELTRNFDNNILEYAFIPGSNDLVAIAEKRQRHEGLHIVFATGDVHEILVNMNPSQLSVAGLPGPLMAMVSDAVDKAPQVYYWSISHANPQAPRAVTSLNAERFAQLSMNPAREFGWRGANGDSVFGLLLTPPNFDASRRYPLVVLIHGGPQGAWLDGFGSRWAPQMFAAPGYVVAMLNPRGSTGFGQRFTDDISRDWGGKVFEDIMRGVDAAAALPYVDSTRMAAAGGSYGGYMVNWINGHTDRFKTLVSHAGVFNLEAMSGATEELWRFSPHRFVQNFHTPTLVIHGALDYRVPETEGMQMFTALQRQNVASRFLYFPDEGHWIGKPQNQLVWWNEVQGWLARYLSRPAS